MRKSDIETLIRRQKKDITKEEVSLVAEMLYVIMDEYTLGFNADVPNEEAIAAFKDNVRLSGKKKIAEDCLKEIEIQAKNVLQDFCKGLQRLAFGGQKNEKEEKTKTKCPKGNAKKGTGRTTSSSRKSNRGQNKVLPKKKASKKTGG